jgi:hypothetical protein
MKGKVVIILSHYCVGQGRENGQICIGTEKDVTISVGKEHTAARRDAKLHRVSNVSGSEQGRNMCCFCAIYLKNKFSFMLGATVDHRRIP